MNGKPMFDCWRMEESSLCANKDLDEMDHANMNRMTDVFALDLYRKIKGISLPGVI